MKEIIIKWEGKPPTIDLSILPSDRLVCDPKEEGIEVAIGEYDYPHRAIYLCGNTENVDMWINMLRHEYLHYILTTKCGRNPEWWNEEEIQRQERLIQKCLD